MILNYGCILNIRIECIYIMFMLIFQITCGVSFGANKNVEGETSSRHEIAEDGWTRDKEAKRRRSDVFLPSCMNQEVRYFNFI